MYKYLYFLKLERRNERRDLMDVYGNHKFSLREILSTGESNLKFAVYVQLVPCITWFRNLFLWLVFTNTKYLGTLLSRKID